LKKLHREILLSATYRQTAHRAVPELAAKIDPTNQYLWPFVRCRAGKLRLATRAALHRRGAGDGISHHWHR
jgi:hypothetical protein